MSKEKSAALAGEGGRDADFAPMSDPFALLGLPRRPWLDEAVIRASFQERARHSHPDARGGDAQAFAALNIAHATVANPAARLRLLAGDAPLPRMPADVPIGFRIAEVMRKIDALRGKEGVAGNVLARALLAGDAASARKELEEIMAALTAASSALDARLRILDERWPDVAVPELAALAGEYIFLHRWQEQAGEGRLALQIAFGKDGKALLSAG